jgi:hypothetical protein
VEQVTGEMGRREGKKQHPKAMLQPSGSKVCWRRKHRESQAPAPASPSSLGRRTANPAFIVETMLNPCRIGW